MQVALLVVASSAHLGEGQLAVGAQCLQCALADVEHIHHLKVVVPLVEWGEG